MNFSLGLIEVEALGHAIYVLDAMTKAANVEFVATERKLGGRLVTLVVKGNVSAVTAAIEAGKALAEEFDCLKASEVIASPHPEILKFLHLDIDGNVIPVVKKEEVKKTETKDVKVEKKVSGKKTEQKAPAKKVSKPSAKASDKKAPAKKSAKTTK